VRQLSRIERALANVADDSNNRSAKLLARPAKSSPSCLDRFPDGVLVREVPTRKLGADDENLRSGRPTAIRIGEETPANERNPHHREVLRASGACLRARLVARVGRWAALNFERELRTIPVEWKAERHIGRTHARNVSNPIEHRVRELDLLLVRRVALGELTNAARVNVGRAKTGIDVTQVRDASEQ
jgi:hypothetical protein